jgi:hypothetical protein
MLLAFGALGNELTSEYEIGSSFEADVHWYPGGIALRALVGRLHSEPSPSHSFPSGRTIGEALAACGWAIVSEPWLERYPMCVSAVPAAIGNGRWVLTDRSGSIPIAPGFTRTAELVCVSGGHAVVVMGEWSTEGFLPLTLVSGNQAVAL